MDWHAHLRTHGYAHLPRPAPQQLVDEALGAMGEPMPVLEVGEPVQLLCGPGWDGRRI